MAYRRPSTYGYPPKFNKLEDAENWAKQLYRELLENDSRGEEITARALAPPTGTGFRHVTAGAEDAAAKLVENADVAAAAAIAVAKLAAGATGQILEMGASLPAWGRKILSSDNPPGPGDGADGDIWLEF